MFNAQITLETLFQQLGLASDEKDMDLFVDQHQLTTDVKLYDAPFWNEEQRLFLTTHETNDKWGVVIELLDELLHDD